MNRGDEVVLFERRQLRWLPMALALVFAVVFAALIPRSLISSQLDCLRIGEQESCSVEAWLGARGVHFDVAAAAITDIRVEQVRAGSHETRPLCTLHLVTAGEEIPALRRSDCERLGEVRSDLRGWLAGGGGEVREGVRPGRQAMLLPLGVLASLTLGLALVRSVRIRVLDHPRRLEVRSWTLAGGNTERHEATQIRAVRADEVTDSDFAGRTATRIRVGARVADDFIVLGGFTTMMDATDLAVAVEKALGLHER